MTAYRADRAGRVGGGSILYISSSLPSRIIHPTTPLPDSLFCEIRPNKSTCVLVGLIYRAPSCTQEAQDFCGILRNCLKRRFTNLLLLGDFNFPHVRFTDNSAPESCPLSQIINDLNLTQHVKVASRLDDSGTGSHLDLLFTNEPFMVSHVTTFPPLGLGDHLVLLFTVDPLYKEPLCRENLAIAKKFPCPDLHSHGFI